MASYFQLFGIEERFEIDTAELKVRFYELSKTVHPDRLSSHHLSAENAIQHTANLNLAFKTLSNKDKRIEYILKAHGLLSDSDKKALSPDFLMEMMEINEAIMDAKMEGASLPSQVFEGIAEQEKVLDSDLNKLMKSFDLTQNKILLTDIEEAWLKKKYILRIKDSLDTFANP